MIFSSVLVILLIELFSTWRRAEIGTKFKKKNYTILIFMYSVPMNKLIRCWWFMCEAWNCFRRNNRILEMNEKSGKVSISPINWVNQIMLISRYNFSQWGSALRSFDLIVSDFTSQYQNELSLVLTKKRKIT